MRTLVALGVAACGFCTDFAAGQSFTAWQGLLIRGMSSDGSTLVGYDLNGSYRWTAESGFEHFGHVYVWTAVHGAETLVSYLTRHGVSLMPWMELQSAEVSADGRTLSGWYRSDSNGYGSYIVTVPAPGVGVVLVTGLAVVRRRGGCR